MAGTSAPTRVFGRSTTVLLENVNINCPQWPIQETLSIFFEPMGIDRSCKVHYQNQKAKRCTGNSMKIAIFGHHPDLFPGFNSLMTANFSYGFACEGHEVHILLPETEMHPQSDRLQEQRLTLDTLDRFGAPEVSIRIITLTSDIEKFDLIVWQSYFPEDEAYWPVVRKAARIVSKNFPRLLTGEAGRDTIELSNACQRFDLVGLALKEDFDLARVTPNVPEEALERCIYQPRGFREDWMKAMSDFDGAPVLGVERGVGERGPEYDYLRPVIQQLREVHPDLEVIGARLDEPGITTRHVGFLPAREFYCQFIAPLWAYLMIDMNRSRQSINAVMRSGRRIYPGLYENQVVEAQMAGAVVVGHKDSLPEELIASGRTGLRFESFCEAKKIVEFLDEAIRNKSEVALEAKTWARKNHSINNMINPVLSAIDTLASVD